MSDDNSNMKKPPEYSVMPPGSSGDLSLRPGYDWRDLKMSGYSDKQIRGVLDGDCTLPALFKIKPEDEPQS